MGVTWDRLADNRKAETNRLVAHRPKNVTAANDNTAFELALAA